LTKRAFQPTLYRRLPGSTGQSRERITPQRSTEPSTNGSARKRRKAPDATARSRRLRALAERLREKFPCDPEALKLADNLEAGANWLAQRSLAKKLAKLPRPQAKPAFDHRNLPLLSPR
jgi:hypothetical protein